MSWIFPSWYQPTTLNMIMFWVGCAIGLALAVGRNYYARHPEKLDRFGGGEEE